MNLKNLIILAVLSLAFFSCQTNTEENNEVVKAQLSSGNNGIDIDKRLDSLGIELPEVTPPVASYVNAVRVGNLLFLAGKGPMQDNGEYITGKLGDNLTVDEGYKAARLVAIQHLAVLKAELGSLNKVKRLVKVMGMVNCTPDFGDQPEVVNGYSNTMLEVFGENGKHARAAVGMNALPRGIAVEVDVVVEIED
ncbi:MAG: RidA family protein [Bacteroidota bacterium]